MTAQPQDKPSQTDDILGQLTAAGVAIWLDDISRERLTTGNLAALVRDRHVAGVTSNPTIFAHAVSHGHAYDEQLADLAVRGVQIDEAARAITTYDIRWGCDVLRPVYDATGAVDGRVSIEVDPRIAKDTAKTIAEARALWWSVDRPNLYIKIPATLEGLPAITQCLSEGISVNVTLIFSLERYGQVIDAFMAGLEQAAAASRGCAARRRSPTPGWPTSCTSSGSPPPGGPRWSRPAPRRSGRCGPPPAPRTPRTTTPCTWWN